MKFFLHLIIILQGLLTIFLISLNTNLSKKLNTHIHNTQTELSHISDLLNWRLKLTDSASKTIQVNQDDLKKLIAQAINEAKHNDTPQAQTSVENSNHYIDNLAVQNIEEKVNQFIAMGKITNDEFFLLTQEASALPLEKRDKLFTKLAKALNKQH